MRARIIFLTALLAIAGCSKKDEVASLSDGYVFPPINIQCSYIAMLESDLARNVLLIGEEAKKCAAFFDEIGIKSCTSPSGKIDLVLMSCKSISRQSCEKVSSFLDDNGSIAWMMDVSDVKAFEFKKTLEDFNFADVRLWMVGQSRWLLTGSKRPRVKKLEDMFLLFSYEGVFERLAEAKCSALQHIFASYAGSRDDIMPAFSAGDLKATVRPEFFLTKEIPSLSWIDSSNVDEDIAKKFFAEARSMQVVRRLAVEGSMLAEAGNEKEAVDSWARAFKRNPLDVFILERLDRLDRNAKGFWEVRKVLMAMKCYETMVLINPGYEAALNNFGMCLKKIGRHDIAERAFRRVKELQEKTQISTGGNKK